MIVLLYIDYPIYISAEAVTYQSDQFCTAPQKEHWKRRHFYFHIWSVFMKSQCITTKTWKQFILQIYCVYIFNTSIPGMMNI